MGYYSFLARFKEELIALIDYDYEVNELAGFREVGASICENEHRQLRFVYGGIAEKPYMAKLEDITGKENST
jgi:hypothetical protein